MRKKRVKVNFGNLLIFIVVIGLFTYGGIYVYNNFISDDTGNSNDKNSILNNNNEDKKVNKKLKELGYSNNDIEKLENNLSSEDIDKINEKYDNLVELSSVKYFHIENIERYQNLSDNSSYDAEEIVMRVNTQIDRDFYTDVKIVDDPNDPFVLVNKYYEVPQDYEPSDLVSVGNGQKMRSEAAEYVNKLIKDINADGLYLQAQSGFRSIDLQTRLYNNYVARDGVEEADTYSARPGSSEHHTGLAIDLSHDGTLEESFENTKQFDWLQKNAHKYGLILRYPKDKVYMTGYMYEPWHYRYVGVEVATLIKNEGITFEEYCVKYKGLY